MTQKLLDDFHQEMQAIYDSALKLKPPYRATYFLQMLGEHGGKRTADRLLATSKPSTWLYRTISAGEGESSPKR